MTRLNAKPSEQIDEMAWAGTRALPLQGLTCLREWNTHRQAPEEITLVEGKK